MKRIICLTFALLLLFSITASAESTNYNINTPYYAYTYNSSDEPIQVPSPYNTTQVLKGSDVSSADFGSLKDVFYDVETNHLFFTDSVTNRIVVLDKEYRLVKELAAFSNNGTTDTFKTPESVCVRDGKMYVADTGNARILVFDSATFELLQVLTKPEIALLGADYAYKPMRLAIDLAGRIYVIAADINDGILLLDTDGAFIRFVAAPDVKTDLWTKFLKMFMTKAQKADLEKSVPTEYSSFLMDSKGFLYLTSSDSTVHPITRLNSQGTDILDYTDNDYPDGDASHWLKATPRITSTFVDIAVRDDEIYAALDTEMGRIFVYDGEGNLLYCFGGTGVQEGTFYSPSAIEIVDDTIIVTDSFYGTVTVFKKSEFGTAVDNAVGAMLKGKYEESKTHWDTVVKLCPTYDAANINLARIDIQNGEYSAALEKLEGTSDITYYSKAFKGVREQFLRDNFTLIVIGIVLLIALIVLFGFLKKKYDFKGKLEKIPLIKQIRYANYTMLHPFDGYWDLKRERRGSLAAANVLTVMFIITYALRVQFSGYIFTGVLPGEVNTLYEIVKIVLPLALWCVANWCFTTLMDGEGTMKDIYIATAYSLRPYIVTAIPLWALSHCLSQDEAFIYTALSSIVMIWMLALIFFGMMITHDYTVFKAIITAVLTLVGICLILFIALTFTNIIQKIYDFAMDLYREFVYRIY